MTFLNSNIFFLVLGFISLFRLFFFYWIGLGSNYGNFEPAYYLENVNRLGRVPFAPIIQYIGIISIIVLPLSLLLRLISSFGRRAPSRVAIVGISLNSILILIYIFSHFIYWWDGFSIGIIVWFLVCLTMLIFPLLGWLLLGFTGIESIIFLFLTTLIQFGLLSHIILSGKIRKNLQIGVTSPTEFNLNLENSDHAIGIGTQTMKNNAPTWTVRIPGQPENPVETATLQNWAKSGFIKADTMVTEVATGYVYQAKQIPGVFSSKSYVTTLLLSFFFGVFGVDRFYLGHVGVGLGKLFTLGGLGIWALIDFILIATKNIKDSQGTPLA
jgi:hypothetical protein